MNTAARSSSLVRRSLAFGLCAALAAFAAAQDSNRVAVLPFVSGIGSFQGDIRASVDGASASTLGFAVSEMVEAKLFSKGVELVDRGHMEETMQEMRLQNTGVFDQATAAQIGKRLGVRYVVVGTVNRLSFEQIKIAFVTRIESRLGVSVKVVEVETGRIVDMYENEVKKSKVDAGFNEVLQRYTNVLRGSAGSARRADQIRYWGSAPLVSDASRSFAEGAAVELCDTLPTIQKKQAGGEVFHVPGRDCAVFDAGKGHGLHEGQRVKVYRVTGVVQHGSASFTKKEEIGEAVVESIQGESVQIKMKRRAGSAPAPKEHDVLQLEALAR